MIPASPTGQPLRTSALSKIFRTGRIAVITVFLLALTLAAEASHFRYGNISWSWVSGRTVQFKVSQAYRRSFSAAYTNAVAGTVINVGSLTYSDNSTASAINLVITSVNAAEDWIYGEATITKTFTTDGIFTAAFSSNARLSTLKNNADLSYRQEAKVTIGGAGLGNSGPASGMPPTVNLPFGRTAATFQLAATDPNGDVLTYRFATAAEMGGGIQPNTMTVNSTGRVTFNTTVTAGTTGNPNMAVNNLYSAVFVVTDTKGATTMIDLMVKIVQASTPPVFNYSITPTSGTVYDIQPGQTVAFSVRVSDIDPGDQVASLVAVGLPTGVSLSPALPASGNPVNVNFSWTPDATQLGTRVISFTAQDNSGNQTTTTVNIIVGTNPVFNVPPTPVSGWTQVVVPGSNYTTPVSATAPDPTVKVRIVSATVPPGATFSPALPSPLGNTSTTNFSWTPAVSNWGKHPVVFTATDDLGKSKNHSINVLVNTTPSFVSTNPGSVTLSANQPFTYNVEVADQDLGYGDVMTLIPLNLPTWLTFTQTSPTTGILSGTPGNANGGTYNVTIIAEDQYHHDHPEIRQDMSFEVIPCPTSGFEISSTAAGGNICSGSSVTLSGWTADSYLWSNGATSSSITEIPAATTTYTLTATSGYCTSTASLTIIVNAPPTVSITSAGTISCNGATVALTSNATAGSGSIASYQWLKNGSPIAGTNNSAFSANTAGSYSVVVTNSNGCTDQSNEIIITTGTRPAVGGIDVYQQSFTNANSCNTIVTYPLSITGSPAPMVNYSFSGATTGSGTGNGSGETYNKGITAVTVTATNSCGTGSNTFNVNVVDNVKPTAICQPVTVALDATGHASVTAQQINNGSSDNCGPVTLSISREGIICGTANENSSITLQAPPGTVIDRIDFASYGTPTGNCGSFAYGWCHSSVSKSRVEGLALGRNSATIAATNGVFGDPCSGTVKNLRVQAHYSAASGAAGTFDCSSLGINQVTLSVADNDGNVSTCTSTVTVVDEIDPTPVVASLADLIGECVVTASAPSATDNCASSITATTSDPVTYTTQGTHTIHWTYTDGSGNQAFQTQTVIVKDLTAPVAQVAILPVVNAQCAVTVNAPRATDNCKGVITATTTDPVTYTAQGTYTINWIYNDGNGNTSTQQQTVVVSDNTAPVFTTANTMGNVPAQILANVPEASGYSMVYQLNMPVNSVLNNAASPAYAVNNAAALASTSFSRIAYYMELDNKWVWVSMDKFTSDVSKTGLPSVGNTAFQQTVNNMNVVASANSGLTSANGITTGNIEFWNNCYGTGNTLGLPGANASRYDFDDQRELASPSCYGSFQVHNYATKQTIFAYNDWAGGGVDDLGIGTNPNGGSGGTHFDWTFAANAGNFTTRRLFVFVSGDNNALTANTGATTCTANVAVTAPQATDNCSVPTVAGVRSDNLALTAPYPKGITTITWTATDAVGNSATRTQTVTVSDKTAPVPNVAALPTITGECSATVSAPKATDNCSGIVTATTNAPTTYTAQGTYVITWTYKDADGNSSTQNQTVIIKDETAPAISCPADIRAIATSAAGATVTYNAPRTSDNCPGLVTTTLVNGLASGSVFPIGETRITYKATDAVGLSTTCTFTVTVEGLPPVIECPANIIVTNMPGQCGANVSFAATEVTAIPASTITYSIAPGSFFPVGTTVVTATATNPVGSSSCNFTVTVKDNEAPVPTAALPVINGECSATATAPTATDNCSGIITATTSDATSFSAQGTYTINWIYTDASGNSTSQVQTVIVRDVTPPVIACAFNVTVNASPNTCGAVVNYNAPSATDNCGNGTLPTALDGYTYQGTFNGHTYFLSNDATNPEDAHARAIALGGHLVTISDASENAFVSAMSPSFIWIGHTDRENEGDFRWVTSEPVNYTNWNGGEPNNWGGNEDWAVINWGPNGTWNDWFYYENALFVVEFEGGNIPTSLVSGLGSGATFPVGTTTETWEAVDAGGNRAVCSFTVTVVDAEAPVLVNVPGDAIVECDAVPLVAAVTATDNCAFNGQVHYNESRIEGNCISNYTLVRNWSTTDAAGNTTSATQVITVQDTKAPTLNTSDVLVNNDAAQCGAVVAFAATASDNCGDVSIAYSQDPGTFFPVGATVVTATATDVCGNTTSRNFTVQVTDAERPVVRTQALIIQLDATGAASITTDQVNDGSTDNCAIASLSLDKTGFDCGNVGANTVTLTVTDIHGNTNSATATITVEDHVAPVISCPESVTLNCQDDNTTAATGVATATDACGVASITSSDVSTQSADRNNAAHYNYVITRTWKATDVAGNSSSCSQVITVRDVTAPAITCPESVTLNCQDNTSVLANGSATATDACGPIAITSSDVSTQSADFNNAAHYNYTITRTWTAVDVSGNSSSCVQIIQVRDVTAPAITCPASVTLNCQDNTSVAANGTATATDNCGPIAIASSDVSTQSADTNNAAHYNYTITRTWTATDVSGNATSCDQLITVQDVTAPAVTTTAGNLDRTAECSDASGIAAALALAPTASDICAPVAIHLVSDVTTNACGTTYTRVRKWNFTDVTGNTSALFTQTLTVLDRTAPVVTSNFGAVELCYDTTSTYCNVTPVAGTDNCTAVTYSYVVKGSNGNTLRSGISANASGTFTVGMNTITWTLKDACGNATTATATVRLNAPITGTFNSFTVSGGIPNTIYTSDYTPAASAAITVVAAGGTAPYTYAWSKTGTAANFTVGANPATITATAVSSGTVVFSVVVTDSKGCKAIFRKTITVIDARCGNKMDKVLVCHGTGSASNPWVQICVAPSAVPAQLGNGSYLGACISNAVTRQQPKSEPTIQATLSAFPNPSHGLVHLRVNGLQGKLQVEVMDSRGSRLMQRELNISYKTEDVTLDLQTAAAGLYTIRVSNGTTVLSTRVVIAR